MYWNWLSWMHEIDAEIDGIFDTKDAVFIIHYRYWGKDPFK